MLGYRAKYSTPQGQTPRDSDLHPRHRSLPPTASAQRHRTRDSVHCIHLAMANTIQFPTYHSRSPRRTHTTSGGSNWAHGFSSLGSPSTARRPTVVPAPRAISCTVCFDNDVRFPLASPTKRCTHKPNVCTDCLSGHIRSAVMDSGLTTVRCPSANCISELAYEDVCSAAGNKAVIERLAT
ncbi:hypothetical protein RHS04_03591 [Rhizoctonia solani]|uniref:RING-type domain-containing protein n=1 Tax=Rhizoctonia solani TaxID=456999 RepID=A0A8H7LKE3_9AGAM|nr:hypothetical protein RHS04_03591 [Rhizoctonia solani]